RRCGAPPQPRAAPGPRGRRPAPSAPRPGGLPREPSPALTQSNVIGQQPRAPASHAPQFKRQSLTPCGQLPGPHFEPRRHRHFRTAALLKTGELRTERGVLLTRAMQAGLYALEFAPRGFQRLLLFEALLLLPGHQQMILLTLSAGALVFLSQPLQLQTRHGQPRTGARVLLGQLALFVIERQRILLLRLL